MRSIIEKLGITKGPYEITGAENHLIASQIFGDARDILLESWWHKEQDLKMHVVADEMLEALIDGALMVENMKVFVEVDSNEYSFYMDSVEIIEKATGKTWSEIKALLELE